MIELPYERQAMRGEPLPAGLCMTDRKLYIALRGLYSQYRAGEVTREQAAADKAELLRDYEHDRFLDDAAAKLRGMWARIEPYATKYANDSTIEHADQFFAAVYGLPEDWRCKRGIGRNRMDQELAKHT